MKKHLVLLLMLVLLIGVIFITGCTVSESRNDKIFTTEKSQTTCGLGGCKTASKTCPMWDRNC